MTWEGFYLVCFVVGFVLAVLGFLGGTLRIPHLHGLHLPGAHAAHLPAHLPAHSAGAVHGGPGHASVDTGSSVSPYNFATFMAFLAWFGGVGYLLTARGNIGRLIVLAIALASGFAGAAIVFGFLTRVLLRHERFLESADFEMVGVLGHVTVGIRPGGTGEIVYSQAGTRRSAGARSETGDAIPRGCEVVVTRYERGIAYVRPWEELSEMGQTSGSPSSEESSHATSVN